jgi:hypothetical protein
MQNRNALDLQAVSAPCPDRYRRAGGTMKVRAAVLLSLLGCAEEEPVELEPSESVTSTTPTPADPWPRSGRSQCDNKASIVQLAVTVPVEAEGTGDLVVALMHRRYGQPEDGGHPHWLWRFDEQPLSATEPTYVNVDMCDGNAVMWSEENCEYNLIVLVDGNDNNGLTGDRVARPDPGEPAILLPYEQSCHHEGPYRFELALDCLDGDACVTYAPEPACECAETACDSESAICKL